MLRVTHGFNMNQRRVLSHAVAIMAKGMSAFQANKSLAGLKDLPQLVHLNTPRSDEDYQEHVLHGVSRTFALTIPQLPGDLCRVVGNAYLLCRIADTIEDEPALTAAQKREFSLQFIKVVGGEESAERFASKLHALLSESTLAAERNLIKNTPGFPFLVAYFPLPHNDCPGPATMRRDVACDYSPEIEKILPA